MAADKGIPKTGDELRAWRTEAGMLQSDLALRLGVTPRTVGNWEQRGDSPLTHQALRRLREVIGTPSRGRAERIAEAERLLASPAEGREPLEVIAEQLRAIGLLLLENHHRPGLIPVPEAWAS